MKKLSVGSFVLLTTAVFIATGFFVFGQPLSAVAESSSYWCNGADMNHDGTVDGNIAGYANWYHNYGNICSDENDNCNGADVNTDGIVDQADYTVLINSNVNGDYTIWYNNYGRTDCEEAGDKCNGADLDQNGTVDQADYTIWYNNIGQTGCVGSDIVAPVITVIGMNPITVAQGSTYTDEGATATDNVDAVVTVTSSGSVNAGTVGDYIITYDTVDVAGNHAITATRVVHVTDQTVPVLTLPANITESTANSAGTAVTYSATATDETDGLVEVTCNHPSGEVFPIGITAVHCGAVDIAGNNAQGDFNVAVILSADSANGSLTGYRN